MRHLPGLALACLVISMAAPPALAAADPAALCDAAAMDAARDSTVPLDVLTAIARAETGRRQGGVFAPWPWTINDGGQGYWFDDAAAAITDAESRLAQGDDNFDIGCFQINTRWHGDAFPSIADMFDPTTNARYAARFLEQLFAETGSWDQAIAAYHSRTPDLAGPYLERVTMLRGEAPAAALPAKVDRGPNLFPLLISGGQGAPGSLVPVQSGLGPLFDTRG